jgi:hypothetical protein
MLQKPKKEKQKQKMSKTSIIKIVLGLIFISISIIFFKNYIEFNSSNKYKPISYLFIDRRINKGGRGESYEMDFKYNNQLKTISITSKEYDLIEMQQYPELYYSEVSDSIYSDWEKKKALRVAILFLILFLTSIFPWKFFVKNK